MARFKYAVVAVRGGVADIVYESENVITIIMDFDNIAEDDETWQEHLDAHLRYLHDDAGRREVTDACTKAFAE